MPVVLPVGRARDVAKPDPSISSVTARIGMDGVAFCAARTAKSPVRRGKAALSSGCKSHPATAPAGSNRSSHGGDEMAEAFG